MKGNHTEWNTKKEDVKICKIRQRRIEEGSNTYEHLRKNKDAKGIKVNI